MFFLIYFLQKLLGKILSIMGVEVDWNWIYEFEHPKPIGNNASINVPELEFLIALKIIGCISRSRKLQRASDRFYFSSKIWKDCYDVANLTNHLDPISQKLHQHFIRTKLDKKTDSGVSTNL